MTYREWLDVDLQISEDDRGLKVHQGGRSYLAKGWALSSEVIDVIELAIRNSLACVIRRGHPSDSKLYETGGSVDYLGFSLTAEHHWVFCLDMDSCKGGGKRRIPVRVKFNKKYRHILRAHNISCQPEWRSPQHLHVDIADLGQALIVVGPHVEALATIRGRRLQRGLHPFFVDEEDLHSYLVQNWQSFPLAKELNLLHSKLQLNGIAHRQGEIDLLAVDKDGNLFVIELKDIAKANVAESPVRQLVRYMEHPDVTQMARSRNGVVYGILIAQDLSHDVCKAVAGAEYPIVAYEATKLREGVRLVQLAASKFHEFRL